VSKVYKIARYGWPIVKGKGHEMEIGGKNYGWIGLECELICRLSEFSRKRCGINHTNSFRMIKH
jgi:hypothetical protein